MVSAKVRRLVIATAAAVEHKGHQSDADQGGNKSAQGQRHVPLRRHRLGRARQTRQTTRLRPIAPAEQLSSGWCRFLAWRLKQTGEATVSATASPREYTRPAQRPCPRARRSL
jgi:hypothetical protein